MSNDFGTNNEKSHENPESYYCNRRPVKSVQVEARGETSNENKIRARSKSAQHGSLDDHPSYSYLNNTYINIGSDVPHTIRSDTHGLVTPPNTNNTLIPFIMETLALPFRYLQRYLYGLPEEKQTTSIENAKKKDVGTLVQTVSLIMNDEDKAKENQSLRDLLKLSRKFDPKKCTDKKSKYSDDNRSKKEDNASSSLSPLLIDLLYPTGWQSREKLSSSLPLEVGTVIRTLKKDEKSFKKHGNPNDKVNRITSAGTYSDEPISKASNECTPLSRQVVSSTGPSSLFCSSSGTWQGLNESDHGSSTNFIENKNLKKSNDHYVKDGINHKSEKKERNCDESKFRRNYSEKISSSPKASHFAKTTEIKLDTKSTKASNDTGRKNLDKNKEDEVKTMNLKKDCSKLLELRSLMSIHGLLEENLNEEHHKATNSLPKEVTHNATTSKGNTLPASNAAFRGKGKNNLPQNTIFSNKLENNRKSNKYDISIKERNNTIVVEVSKQNSISSSSQSQHTCSINNLQEKQELKVCNIEPLTESHESQEISSKTVNNLVHNNVVPIYTLNTSNKHKNTNDLKDNPSNDTQKESEVDKEFCSKVPQEELNENLAHEYVSDTSVETRSQKSTSVAEKQAASDLSKTHEIPTTSIKARDKSDTYLPEEGLSVSCNKHFTPAKPLASRNKDPDKYTAMEELVPFSEEQTSDCLWSKLSSPSFSPDVEGIVELKTSKSLLNCSEEPCTEVGSFNKTTETSSSKGKHSTSISDICRNKWRKHIPSLGSDSDSSQITLERFEDILNAPKTEHSFTPTLLNEASDLRSVFDANNESFQNSSPCSEISKQAVTSVSSNSNNSLTCRAAGISDSSSELSLMNAAMWKSKLRSSIQEAMERKSKRTSQNMVNSGEHLDRSSRTSRSMSVSFRSPLESIESSLTSLSGESPEVSYVTWNRTAMSVSAHALTNNENINSEELEKLLGDNISLSSELSQISAVNDLNDLWLNRKEIGNIEATTLSHMSPRSSMDYSLKSQALSACVPVQYAVNQMSQKENKRSRNDDKNEESSENNPSEKLVCNRKKSSRNLYNSVDENSSNIACAEHSSKTRESSETSLAITEGEGDNQLSDIHDENVVDRKMYETNSLIDIRSIAEPTRGSQSKEMAEELYKLEHEKGVGFPEEDENQYTLCHQDYEEEKPLCVKKKSSRYLRDNLARSAEVLGEETVVPSNTVSSNEEKEDANTGIELTSSNSTHMTFKPINSKPNSSSQFNSNQKELNSGSSKEYLTYDSNKNKSSSPVSLRSKTQWKSVHPTKKKADFSRTDNIAVRNESESLTLLAGENLCEDFTSSDSANYSGSKNLPSVSRQNSHLSQLKRKESSSFVESNDFEFISKQVAATETSNLNNQVSMADASTNTSEGSGLIKYLLSGRVKPLELDIKLSEAHGNSKLSMNGYKTPEQNLDLGTKSSGQIPKLKKMLSIYTGDDLNDSEPEPINENYDISLSSINKSHNFHDCNKEQEPLKNNSSYLKGVNFDTEVNHSHFKPKPLTEDVTTEPVESEDHSFVNTDTRKQGFNSPRGVDEEKANTSSDLESNSTIIQTQKKKKMRGLNNEHHEIENESLKNNSDIDEEFPWKEAAHLSKPMAVSQADIQETSPLSQPSQDDHHTARNTPVSTKQTDSLDEYGKSKDGNERTIDITSDKISDNNMDEIKEIKEKEENNTQQSNETVNDTESGGDSASNYKAEGKGTESQNKSVNENRGKDTGKSTKEEEKEQTNVEERTNSLLSWGNILPGLRYLLGPVMDEAILDTVHVIKGDEGCEICPERRSEQEDNARVVSCKGTPENEGTAGNEGDEDANKVAERENDDDDELFAEEEDEASNENGEVEDVASKGTKETDSITVSKGDEETGEDETGESMDKNKQEIPQDEIDEEN